MAVVVAGKERMGVGVSEGEWVWGGYLERISGEVRKRKGGKLGVMNAGTANSTPNLHQYYRQELTKYSG